MLVYTDDERHKHLRLRKPSRIGQQQFCKVVYLWLDYRYGSWRLANTSLTDMVCGKWQPVTISNFCKSDARGLHA
jgi:hypothetical protein